jgi:hypothetical protein
MAKRFTDTELWEEDWFLELPDNYKLFYLYIKAKCDHSGIWRVNKKKFQVVSKIMFLDDFLDAVNKDEDGKDVKRVIVLEKGKWFIPGFISEQCGNSFNMGIGAHRGVLKLLVTNGIPLAEVPDFDFGEIKNYENQQLRNLVHSKTMYREYIDHAKTMHRYKEKEKEKEKEIEKGGVGEKEEMPEIYPEKNFEPEPKFVVPEMLKIFKNHIKDYPDDQELDFHALKNISDFITKQSPDLKFDLGYTIDKWERICGFIESSSFYRMKSLKTIANTIQSLYQETFNPKAINGKQKQHVNGSREQGLSNAADRLREKLDGLDRR